MEPDEWAAMAAIEEDYWWYRNTRGIIADLLDPWLTSDQKILDVGSGTGAIGRRFSRHGTVTAVDRAEAALPYLRRGPLLPVQARAEHLPFAPATFDLAIAVNVLYSVPDPGAAVADIGRVVAPGGAVLLMEPAFTGLTRAHDARVHGLRRFRRAELGAHLEAAGLRLERSTYAYACLAPPAALHAVAYRLAPSGVLGRSTAVHRRSSDHLLGALAARERAWLRTRDLRVGTSVLALASKP